MQLELKPSPKLLYKLRLTPQMRLAISLLQMPLIKLKKYIKQQLEENPLLESVDHASEEERDFQDNYRLNDEENYKESLVTKPTSLTEHLSNQLHLLANSDDEQKIGEIIIDNIDDNGYLKSSLEEIAEISKTDLNLCEKVLSLIQTFDPIGVGARDLRECLLLQINSIRNIKAITGKDKISHGVKTKGQEDSLSGQIINKYLPYLERKRFEFIAKKLKCSVERIKEAIKEIAQLEPKPGRSFNTERTVRLIPDIILERNNDKYEVVLNDGQLPSLSLNPKYKALLKTKDISEDTKEYLRDRLKSARSLINALNKRRQTLQKVAEAICLIQRDFLDKGLFNLKPMTLTQVARLVGRHKSTVSRAIANKYLQTPYGIFELEQFLNSGVKQGNGILYSSKAIKLKIKELIKTENKEIPLTDQEIAQHLKLEGISISRRTIAKYRHQLKILSFPSRRE